MSYRESSISSFSPLSVWIKLRFNTLKVCDICIVSHRRQKGSKTALLCLVEQDSNSTVQVLLSLGKSICLANFFTCGVYFRAQFPESNLVVDDVHVCGSADCLIHNRKFRRDEKFTSLYLRSSLAVRWVAERVRLLMNYELVRLINF
jgi:hypothetical protein